MFNKIYNITKKAVDEVEATVEGIFSTSDEDRHGDVVEQNWDLKAFKQNPVILNSHDYSDALNVIGRAENIAVKDGKLQGKIKFAVDENPKAKIIFDLVKNGFINAFSVGFIPKEFDDKNKILKSELLEISIVSVPANAMALAKSKGINIEKLYESDENNQSTATGDGAGDTANGDSGAGDAGDGNGDDKTKSVLIKSDDNWENAENEVRFKIRDIDQFEDGTFAKVTVKDQMPAVKAIIAQLKGDNKKVIQSLRFDKGEGWTMDDAKKWFSQNENSMVNWSNAIEEKSKSNEKILKVLNILGEELKVETRTASDKAKKRNIINRGIRELRKEKLTIR